MSQPLQTTSPAGVAGTEGLPVVLIVGASGFVGGHTLRHLRELGWRVAGTRSHGSSPDLRAFDLARDRLGDRVDQLMGDAGRPSHVVICAAMAQPDRCFRERELSYQVNVVGTIRLIEDTLALGARPVYMTSGFAYDGLAGYYTDDEPRWPINEYGRHKAEVEEYCAAHQPGMLLFRLDKVIGDDPAENHMFSEWYRWHLEGKPIICISDQLFSPTNVHDVARAIRIGCGQNLGGVYNIANPEFFTREELARQFFRILGAPARIICKTQEELNFVDLRPEKTYLDSSRFQRDAGFHFTSVRETIQTFIGNLNRTS
jgi:dTDP-4-dehydrorhamnose reductase